MAYNLPLNKFSLKNKSQNIFVGKIIFSIQVSLENFTEIYPSKNVWSQDHFPTKGSPQSASRANLKRHYWATPISLPGPPYHPAGPTNDTTGHLNQPPWSASSDTMGPPQSASRGHLKRPCGYQFFLKKLCKF